MKHILVILCFLLMSGGLTAQDQARNAGQDQYFFQVIYHQGVHWNRTLYLQEQMSAGFKGIEARFGMQTAGKKPWQQLNHYPRYGIGIHYADEIRDKADTTLGNPISLFIFYNAAWAKFGRFSLNTNLSAGLSYNPLVYDPVTNPYNDVVGSHINLYLDASLFLGIRLCERLDLNAGYGMNHYSNGRIHMPQKGLNNWGWNAGLTYLFGGGQKPFRRSDKIYTKPPEFQPYEEIQLMASVGVTEWQLPSMPEGYHYMASSLSADYAYRFAVRSALTMGLDIFYDGSLERSLKIAPEEVDFLQKTQLGAHLGYQVSISRFTILLNLGTYFMQHTYIRGFYYSRAGGRIRLTDHLDLHLCIKSRNGIRSDYIEWGMAYHIKTR